uniref:Uncharacterized protein n=1 Tax=Timema cristinae TaxID=61476 RepID=A0A7R9CFD1_TIMCR|nr:unnamed protein product [Timema cristinae]
MYGKIFPSTAPKRFTETDLRTRLLSGWVPEDWISSVGEIRVEFTADTLKLNLIELGRAGSKLIMVAGHVDFMCQEVEAADPVTFTTRDSNLIYEPNRSHDECFALLVSVNVAWCPNHYWLVIRRTTEL